MAQWFSIGLQLGFTAAQINSFTFDKPSLSSKLEAIIHQKIDQSDVKETERSLLIACTRIPQPIIGAVWEYIDKETIGMNPCQSLTGGRGSHDVNFYLCPLCYV